MHSYTDEARFSRLYCMSSLLSPLPLMQSFPFSYGRVLLIDAHVKSKSAQTAQFYVTNCAN